MSPDLEFIRDLTDILGYHPLSIPHDPDQAWFFTNDWQRSEREVDAELAAGKSKVFTNAEDFLAELDAEDET